MLQQMCEYIHNYFIKEPICGEFAIADGVISPSLDLLDGQRIWITGSVLNDGVYTYHTDGIKNDDDTEVAGLQDETWAGTICALAVPPAVIALSAEINAWVEANGDSVNSPYTSESVIGVYSYTKATVTGKDGTTKPLGWREMFGDQLNRWRKVSF